jgi:3-oxoacyl-[acyl-carrier-protein] synthase-3
VLDQATTCHIHTGSRKILDGVCAQLGLAQSSPQVATSYLVLREHANLFGASVGYMLERTRGRPGSTVVLSFGVGFAASAGVLQAA